MSGPTPPTDAVATALQQRQLSLLWQLADLAGQLSASLASRRLEPDQRLRAMSIAAALSDASAGLAQAAEQSGADAV